jgi:hypothetical protein
MVPRYIQKNPYMKPWKGKIGNYIAVDGRPWDLRECKLSR